jgi:glycosyltransferase involved in cell wall biosynthesis
VHSPFAPSPNPIDWRAETVAVVPCLNEASSIASLLRQIREHLNTVCVVDDGSTDATGAVAREGGAFVIRHPAPQGKGLALRAGWKWAQERGFRWAFTLDGDGQHAPSEMPAFWTAAARTRAKLIVGNRMLEPRRMPWGRRFVNRWMSRRLSRLVGQQLPDSQCGYRLLDLEALRGLPLSAANFEIESDVLVSFARAGHRIEFVPIPVIYRQEKSKIRPLRDGLRWYRWWRRVRAQNEEGDSLDVAQQPSPADA